MKTWNQFLENKQNEANAMLAPMSQQPATAGIRPSARRSATMNPQDVQRYAQGQQTRQPAPAGPGYGAPVSDEETGQQYAKSMGIQQQMARSQMGRRV